MSHAVPRPGSNIWPVPDSHWMSKTDDKQAQINLIYVIPWDLGINYVKKKMKIL